MITHALKKLTTVLHSRTSEPDVRRLSLRAFVIELCTLDSKISAAFTQDNTYLITDSSVRKSLRFDIGLSRQQRERLLYELEKHFSISFNKQDREALARTGFRISHLYQRCLRAAWRKSYHRRSSCAVPQ